MEEIIGLGLNYGCINYKGKVYDIVLEKKCRNNFDLYRKISIVKIYWYSML